MYKQILLLIGCLVVLFCCISTSRPEPIQDSETLREVNDYSFWETEDSTEYINFLNKLDSDDRYRILSVSNSSYAFEYTGPYNIYAILYTLSEDSEEENIHYQYSIFETETEEELTNFLSTIGDEYEIFDISIGSYAFRYTGPYHTFIVTYRKAL